MLYWHIRDLFSGVFVVMWSNCWFDVGTYWKRQTLSKQADVEALQHMVEMHHSESHLCPGELIKTPTVLYANYVLYLLIAYPTHYRSVLVNLLTINSMNPSQLKDSMCSASCVVAAESRREDWDTGEHPGLEDLPGAAAQRAHHSKGQSRAPFVCCWMLSCGEPVSTKANILSS